MSNQLLSSPVARLLCTRMTPYLWFFFIWTSSVAGASDRVSISFRFHSFEEINLQTLTLQVVPRGPPDVGHFIVGHRVGNNTYRGKMNIPWKNEPQARQLQFTIASKGFLQKNIGMFVKPQGETNLKMTTEDYRIHLTTSVNSYGKVNVSAKNGCGCVKRNCACCETIRLSELKFDHTICVNISYNAETIGIELAVGVDNHYVVLEEISARNPPPICFNIPGVHEIADMCLAFTKLDFTRQHLAGCVEIELELAHLRVFHIPLGCFNMPI